MDIRWKVEKYLRKNPTNPTVLTVLAYNIEVVKNGQAHRVAVDAGTGRVIADPGPFLKASRLLNPRSRGFSQRISMVLPLGSRRKMSANSAQWARGSMACSGAASS